MEELYGCQRIFILQDGKVRMEGNPRDIFTNTAMMIFFKG
jgi:ABC-type lipopolysaccharide export system ATPase subunit